VRIASANPVTRRIWRSLSDARRSRMLGWYRRANFRFNSWNRRGAVASRDTDEDLAALSRLREHYQPDGRRLAALLGQAPPWDTPEPQADAERLG
ncbi:MAG: hypothetical protein ACRDQZ_07805, partial [Mycobacteriales bacterium]